MSRFVLLTRHIQELQKGDYGKVVVSGGHAGTTEDPIPMPYMDYSDAVESLHRDIYDFCEAHPEYDHTNYQKTLEENGLNWDMDSMSNADVSTLDAKTVIGLLIGACRAERFCDGAIMEFLENGSIIRWLKRLVELDETTPDVGSTISIQKIGITKLAVDCIVNAANSGLMEGGGVCGAIFREAGSYELQKACDRYGGCKTGSAVITPGFKLKAKYIIHAVGPRWNGGTHGEREQLYSCYQASMKLAEENDCHTIAFPVISSGIFGYPKKEAWLVAVQSVRDYQGTHKDYKLDVVFAVLSDDAFELGNSVLSEV